MLHAAREPTLLEAGYSQVICGSLLLLLVGEVWMQHYREIHCGTLKFHRVHYQL